MSFGRQIRRLAFAGLAAAAIGAASGARATATDAGCAAAWWPQPRQSSCGNGSVGDAAAPSPSNVRSLRLAWSYDTKTGPVQPIVFKGGTMRTPYVYFVADGRLHALELATGRRRWSVWAGFEFTKPIAPASAVVDDGDLLYHSDVVVRRFVPRSGHIVWQRTFRELAVWPAVIADGRWYLAGEDYLSAWTARTGRFLWQSQLIGFNCNVAAAGGRLYVGGGSDPDGGGPGVVYALDGRTGTILWSTRIGAEPGTPVLAGGRLFVRGAVNRDGVHRFFVEALRASDGRRLWRTPVGSAKLTWFAPPSADGDLVVYPGVDNTLYALGAADGKLRWTAAHITNTVLPAIVNGLVWAGDDAGRIVAYDARTGRRLWSSRRFQPDGVSSPVIAGHFLLISSSDGRLLAYRTAGG